MTSKGFRLSILILTAVSLLPPAGAGAKSVLRRGYPSARIYALGSDFAGIIPDGPTDLTPVSYTHLRAHET